MVSYQNIVTKIPEGEGFVYKLERKIVNEDQGTITKEGYGVFTLEQIQHRIDEIQEGLDLWNTFKSEAESL